MKDKTGIKILWILLLPVLLVVGLRLWALFGQGWHLKQIALEIGSIGQYRVGINLNHSGESMIFFRETEKGLGTFFCETSTGKAKLLYEEQEKDWRARFRLLGWSADDKILIFAIMSNEQLTNGMGEIKICNGHTGEVLTNIPAEGFAGDSQFAWLSARSFVYSTFSHRSWLVYAQKADGTWNQTQVAKRFADGRLTNLVAATSHSIAWRNNQAVWIYDFADSSVKKVWQATTNQLTALTVSEAGNLLLSCQDHAGAYLAEFRSPRMGEGEGSIINVTKPLPIPPDAHVEMKAGKFVVRIQTNDGTNPATFQWDGMMHYFDGVLHYYAVCGERLFFVGSKSDGIPGIWEYDSKSGNFRQIDSALQTPLKRAKMVEPIVGVYTNQVGQQVSYHIWMPDDKNGNVKRPIILGKELHIWNPLQQMAANAGWIYAKIDLVDWDMSKWPEDMAGFYQTILKIPDIQIDTNKVFFFASSGQNKYVDALSQNQAVNFNGLILHHPAYLYSLSNSRFKNALILGAQDDKFEDVPSLIKIQDAAFNEGSCVNFLLQDGVQHLTRSIPSEREQTQEIARFLSEHR